MSVIWTLNPGVSPRTGGKQVRETGLRQPASQKTDHGQQELFEPSQAQELSLLTTGTRIYISGLVDHKQLSILLDTGATSCILSEDSWRKRTVMP